MFTLADKLICDNSNIPHVDKLCVPRSLQNLRCFVAGRACWRVHFVLKILGNVLNSLRFHKRFADAEVDYLYLREIFRDENVFGLQIPMAYTSLLHVADGFE